MELTCNAIIYQLYSIDIAKKVEVDGGAELTEDFLHSEIHPVITINIITIHHRHQLISITLNDVWAHET